MTFLVDDSSDDMFKSIRATENSKLSNQKQVSGFKVKCYDLFTNLCAFVFVGLVDFESD